MMAVSVTRWIRLRQCEGLCGLDGDSQGDEMD